MKRLAHDEAGSTIVEFAFVAPVFLMTIFLILDGARMMFTKQALNELAVATARCAGIKAPNCTTASDAQNWAATRGTQRSALQITSSNVTVVQSTSCNGQSNMAQATITITYKKGAMNLLPQSVAPSQLTSIGCFPAS